MNQNNKMEKSNNRDGNVVEPRKIWRLATIGLPDSGKSTFLARLYATHIEGDQHRGNRFRLSFPPAISESEAEREVLLKIEELWRWIRDKYDKKLKTVEGANIVFNLSGRSLPQGLSVHTSDVPGEIFASLPDVGAVDIDSDVLKQLKKEFREICRSVQAVMVLISAEEIDDVQNGALVKAMLDYMPKRTRWGMPIFKLVVFTKAAKVLDSVDLQPRIRKLESRWRQQGIKWLKVIACESLADLRQIERDGKTHWELPPAGSESPYPQWIHTPYSAVLELPRMLVSYRRWLKVKLSLSAAVIMAALCGTWVYQGWTRDNLAFQDAKSRPSSEEQCLDLETYLTKSRACKANWYYPFRHNTGDAILLWNERYFEALEKQDNLEKRMEQLVRVEAPHLWRFTDKEKHEEVRRRTEDEIKNIRSEHDKKLKKWSEEAKASDHPPSVIERGPASEPSSPGPEPERTLKVPSLAQKTERRRERLKDTYEEEEKSVNDFSELSKDWRARVQELTRELEALATASPLTYRVMQEGRNGRLRQLGLDVCNTGGEHMPFKSLHLSRALQGAIKRQIGDEADILQKLKDAENDLEGRIRELEKTHAAKDQEFSEELDWDKKVVLCRGMIRELKDHPLADEWAKRAQEWGNKVKASEDSMRGLRLKVSEAPMTPQRQIDLWQEFLTEGAFERVSPRHQEVAKIEINRLESEKKEIDDRWEEVEKVASRFERNKKIVNELRGKLEDYESLLRQQGRPFITDHQKKHGEIRANLEREEKQVIELRARFDGLWVDMTLAKPPQSTDIRRKIAEVLSQLVESYEEAYSHRRIIEFYEHINRLAEQLLDVPFGRDDIDFQEAVTALKLGEEYADQLKREEEKKKALKDKQVQVYKEWSDQKWHTVKDEAEKSAGQGAYAEAIRRLQGYRDQKGAAYEIFGHDADKAIEQHADKWRKSLLYRMAEKAKSQIKLRDDYDKRKEEIEGEYGEYEQIIGVEHVDATVRETYRSAIDDLDKRLREWYLARVHNLCDELPICASNENTRILSAWLHVDELRKLLQEMKDDESFEQLFEEDAARVRRMEKQIDETNLCSNVTFQLVISSMNIRLPDKNHYWFSNFPEPKLKLFHNTNEIWSLDISKEKNETSAEDSTRRQRHYKVRKVENSEEGNSFVVESDQWNEPLAGVQYARGDKLALKVKIARQDSPKEVELLLIAEDQTPGRLLQADERRHKEKVVCKTKFRETEFEMEIELDLKVSVKGDEALKRFLIPNDFENW